VRGSLLVGTTVVAAVLALMADLAGRASAAGRKHCAAPPPLITRADRASGTVMRIDASKGIKTIGMPCSGARAVGRAWAKKCDRARRRGDCMFVLSGTGYRFSCVETVVGAPGSGGYALEKLTGTYRHHRASLRFYASFVGI
jgi:hypothetical protein